MKTVCMPKIPLVISTILAALAVGVVYADFSVGGQLSSDSTNCGLNNLKDPLNVLYWNYGDNDRSVNHFMAHVGWSNTQGAMLYMYHHNGSCQGQTATRANGSLFSERKHLRFFNVNDSDSVYGLWTAGGVHWDEFCDFVHRGIDFNIMRDNLLSFFTQPEHPTATFQFDEGYSLWIECLNYYEPVDGKMGKISIPSTSH